MKRPKQVSNWFSFRGRFLCIMLMFFTFIFFCVLPIQAQVGHCKLKKVDSIYAGSCLCKDSLLFFLNLTPPPSNEIGFWKGGSTLQGPPANDPIFLEVRKKGGTLATHYRALEGEPTAWYDITNFKNTNEEIEFSFDMTQLSKGRGNDIKILERVKFYLSDSTKWNRYDHRYYSYIDCQPNNKKKTLFCALYAAQTDILGDFYGGPSFGALGIAIYKKFGEFNHPLQGFNNDLKITLKDLHVVIDEAIRSIKENLSKDE